MPSLLGKGAREPRRTHRVRRALARCRSVFPGAVARAGVAAGLALVLAPLFTRAHAQTRVPHDTLRVLNRAYLAYHGEGRLQGDSASAAVIVKLAAALRLVAPQSAQVVPNERRVFAHTLTNDGTGPDRVTLVAVLGGAAAGWPVRLYADVDGNGALGPRDTLLTAPVPLERGASAALLAVTDVPADAADDLAADLTVLGTSDVDWAVVARVVDRVTVRRPRLPGVTVGKTVDRAWATRADTVTFTITVANGGTGPTPEPAVVLDPLPVGLRLLPGGARLDGAALPEAADADPLTLTRDAARDRVRVDLGVLAPGDRHVLVLRALVGDDAPVGALSNVAAVASGDTAMSAPADTRVALAALAATKAVLGADSVAIGNTVRYRLGWRNTSPEVPSRQTEMVDTLPPELQFVSAEGTPTVQGQVVRWDLGTLAPLAEGALELVVRVIAPPPRGATIVNRLVVRGQTAAAAAQAVALPVRVTGLRGDELVLAKQAGVLEAGLGDAVPYVLTLRNRGVLPLTGLVVRDELPAEMALARAADGRYRVAGADSVHVEGRVVTLFVAGPLAPDAVRILRYAAAVTRAGRARVLENRAAARAEAGAVRTDTVVARVRLRGTFALRGRTLVGKVYLDRNRDGRQQPGEEGVPRVRILTADGLAVVTDGEGRFSIADLAPGTHGLRLDTLGLAPALMLPEAGAEFQIVRTDGWTMPRASFRLVPRPGVDCDTLTAAALAPRAATVPALRRAADRAVDAGAEMLVGPGVRITHPADGAVLGTNRLYVGVRGEPGAQVQLFDGDSLRRAAQLRPDGSQDFVGLELARGPHVLRAVITNSWGQRRVDSLRVHLSGLPAAIELADSAIAATAAAAGLSLRAEAAQPTTLAVRVLDRWGVPVVAGPTLTVTAKGATVSGADVDASSVGLQLAVGPDGVARVPVLPGRHVGVGELALASEGARQRVALQILPALRPFTVTAVGQVGAGAAPSAFGSLTARGAVGSETSITVTADTRRGAADAVPAFQRGLDPLDEARYPILGDASERQVLVASTTPVAARVERRLDWLAFGDVTTPGFNAGDRRLATYTRALTGVSGRLTTGAATWNGFGSVTRQRLVQRQLRGDGTSGPYRMGAGVRPGTECVAVEVRASENAARVIARVELVREADYDVDYLTGAVLLRRPVPSADTYGNPVYVVVTAEQTGAGEARLVGGLRVELDAGRWLRDLGWDSVTVGATGVHDAGGAPRGLGADATVRTAGAADDDGTGAVDFAGADLRLRKGGIDVAAEALRAQSPDSVALATQASLRATLPGEWAALEAGWLQVAGGFTTPLNPRLAAPVDEIRLALTAHAGTAADLRAEHQRQRFPLYGVARQTTGLHVEERLAKRTFTQELSLVTEQLDLAARARQLEAMGGTPSPADTLRRIGVADATLLSAKASAQLASRLTVWGEATHALAADPVLPARPDAYAVGARVRVVRRLSLETARRWVQQPNDTVRYAITSAGLRLEGLVGGTLAADVERTAGLRAADALTLGWTQRLALEHGWQVSSLLERRVGLAQAAAAAPVRALPFAQAELDHWAVGLGAEWLPGDERARFSLRGERHGGQDRDGYRVALAADAPLGGDVALLTLQDWAADQRPALRGWTTTRQDRSLLGLALRPAATDVVNALLKVEWRRTMNPVGQTQFSVAGEDRRLLGAADVVWAPAAGTELAARYALRWTTPSAAAVGAEAPGPDTTDAGGADTVAAGLASTASTRAHYAGLRIDQRVWRPLGLRVDGRLLRETATAHTTWSAAAALTVRVGPRLLVEGGYRAGLLRDPDFAAVAGQGLYVLVSARVTEALVHHPGAFWRDRVAQDR